MGRGQGGGGGGGGEGRGRKSEGSTPDTAIFLFFAKHIIVGRLFRNEYEYMLLYVQRSEVAY